MLSDEASVEKLLRSPECRTRISTRSRDKIEPEPDGFAGNVPETKFVSASGPKTGTGS